MKRIAATALLSGLLASCSTTQMEKERLGSDTSVTSFVIGPTVDAPFDPTSQHWTRITEKRIVETTMKRIEEWETGEYPHVLLFRALQIVALNSDNEVVEGYIFDGSAGKAGAPVIRKAVMRRTGRLVHVDCHPDDPFLEHGIVAPEMKDYRYLKRKSEPLTPPGT